MKDRGERHRTKNTSSGRDAQIESLVGERAKYICVLGVVVATFDRDGVGSHEGGRPVEDDAGRFTLPR